MKSLGGRSKVLVLLWLLALLSAPARARAEGDDSALPPAPPAPPAIELAPEPGAAPVADPPAVERAAVTPAAVAPSRATSTSRSGLDDPERTWYGWQLLINDFVALGALGGAAAAGVRGNGALAVIVPAAIVYDLGSPTIHWLHGRKAIAGASLGVRAGVPFVGVMIGVAVAGCSRERSSSADTCRSQGAGYGALAGFAAATALDAALFAFDTPPAEKSRASAVSWSPAVTARDGGATFGVVGVF